MRYPLLLSALLLTACGDDASTSAAGSGGAGSGGESASLDASSATGDEGGADLQTTAETSTVGPVTSATSTVGPGSSGAGGAGEGGSADGGGGAGEGGAAPLCDAVGCGFSNDATETINCRPDCGDVDERCTTNVCVPDDPEDEIYLVEAGIVEILTPALEEADPTCAAECGPNSSILWAMRLRILAGDPNYAIAIDGPEGSIMEQQFTEATSGDLGLTSTCDVSDVAEAGGCATGDGASNYLTLAIDTLHPTGGARFRIETVVVGGIGGEDPPVPACDGGCNGGGG